MLKKLFPVTSFWVSGLVIGFVLVELTVCVVLWQMEINRYDLRFIEFRLLSETLIFAFIGLCVGLLQQKVLNR